MNKKFTLFNDDCLKAMAQLPDGSIDAIIADPPYAATQAEWDTIIPVSEMWEQLNRLIKPKGNIVLHSQQPYTTDLINGNRKKFKYASVWDKVEISNFMSAKYQRLQRHEDILVFGDAGSTYNPQMTKRDKPLKRSKNTGTGNSYGDGTLVADGHLYTEKHPTSIVQFNPPHRAKRLHGHQKPVELMEYLIKTYSNSGETVLDFSMGSGTTGVAAMRTGRVFIGIEIDEEFFKIARDRIYGAMEAENNIEQLITF